MDPEVYALLAKKVDLFHGIGADDISKIFARGLTIRASKGETIFFKGTIGSQMYVVLAGKIAIYDESRCLATLTTGDMFGEMALVDKAPRSGTAVAMEDSHLFVLSEVTFHKLLNKTVAIKILLNIVRTLSFRLRETNKKVSRQNV
jgi:CRP-like cAMP-binding protein